MEAEDRAGLEAGGLVEPDSPLDVAGDHAVEGQYVRW
jgi:hypothetical protein